MSPGRQPASPIHYRRLRRGDLERIGDIDRTERIDTLYVQDGVALQERKGDWSASAWFREGDGEHSVAYQRAECERHAAAGAIALGAFAGERLVGIGLVTPGIQPSIAQLAYLHVSDGFRGEGIGATLTTGLERIARDAGDTSMVVSATPSQNTVRFYLGRGFELMAEPLPELFVLEPEDVHMQKSL